MKVKSYLIVFLITIFFLISKSSAGIIETDSLKPLQEATKHARAQALIIFDVDDVLIMPKDQILQKINKQYLEILNKKLEEKYSEEELQTLWSIIFKSRNAELVDSHVLEIFKELKQKNIKVLILTNAWTGPFGQIPSLENWRINELRNLGIDLSWSFDKMQPVVFEQLKTKDPKRSPIYKEGVLFTSNLSKGIVLDKFLETIKWYPTQIIFIDDKLKNLDSVQEFSKQKSIDFAGFQYTAVKNLPVRPLNEKRAELQFNILEKERKWLSDPQADIYMKKSQSQ